MHKDEKTEAVATGRGAFQLSVKRFRRAGLQTGKGFTLRVFCGTLALLSLPLLNLTQHAFRIAAELYTRIDLN